MQVILISLLLRPLENVAYRMRQRMHMEENRLRELGIDDPAYWINNNIGTVHTFQGKEAKAVILLLGAPSPYTKWCEKLGDIKCKPAQCRSISGKNRNFLRSR